MAVQLVKICFVLMITLLAFEAIRLGAEERALQFAALFAEDLRSVAERRQRFA